MQLRGQLGGHVAHEAPDRGGSHRHGHDRHVEPGFGQLRLDRLRSLLEVDEGDDHAPAGDLDLHCGLGRVGPRDGEERARDDGHGGRGGAERRQHPSALPAGDGPR